MRTVTAGGCAAVAASEQGRQCELEVLEVLERQVEACREPAEHQMRDTLEGRLPWQRERDLISHRVGFSSSSRSRSRRAAAALPSSTASRQLRSVFNDDHPCETPAVKPVSFCTGRLTAKLTVRTASSTATTASTALVGRGVHLVELRVHTVDRPSDLVDHRQHLALGSLDQRREPVERHGEAQKRPADTDPDRDQEERRARDGRDRCS